MIVFRDLRLGMALAALTGAMFGTSGCGSAGAPAATAPPASPTSATLVPSVYVGNLTHSNGYQVLQFVRGATGSASPLATLALPSGFEISCLATDLAGHIYVGGAQASGTTYQWEVLVYAAGASGAATPLRTVLGSSTAFLTVLGITVDTAGQLYISTNQPSPRVVVMAADANGAATPARTLTGALTQLGNLAYGIAVDNSGTIYVANTNGASVLAFAASASGNSMPIRVISGTNTGFNGLYGIDVDSSGTLYVMSVYQIPAVTTVTTVAEFSSSANGNVAPLRTITGSNTGLNNFASFVRVDSGGTLYLSGDSGGSTPFVSSFASGANGNVAPLLSFTSSVWTGNGYYGIALR